MSRDERPREEDLNHLDASARLRHGELEIVGLLPNSSNYTFLVRVCDGGGEELAVYKPRLGETPLWDFPEGSLCQREVAASVVASFLGWPNVPATVLRDGPHGTGSVQRFVRFDPAEHYFTLEERFPAAFRAIAAFDLIVNNADRKGGHCLLGEDGRIWSIDHGVCFHEEPKLRTVIWEYLDEPIPADLVEDLARLGAALGRRTEPYLLLSALLTPGEIEALRGRIDAVEASPVFPRPTGDRPFPWPPV